MTTVRFIGNIRQHLWACNWCEENIGPHNERWYGSWNEIYEPLFNFEKESDATLFALRWL